MEHLTQGLDQETKEVGFNNGCAAVKSSLTAAQTCFICKNNDCRHQRYIQSLPIKRYGVSSL